MLLYIMLICCLVVCNGHDWDLFVDRIDLLIKESFLIIECSENEIQIDRKVTTFEQFESNLKCQNKNELIEHGNDRVQIIDFTEIILTCEKNQLIHIKGEFKQIKSSLDKTKNQVDWPYLHTPFTKSLQKTDPYKMKFLNQNKKELLLTKINLNELPNDKQTFYIYLDFVNRPMICRIRIAGLQKKTNKGSCDAHIIDTVYEPTCYYKVGAQSPLSDEQFDDIVKKIWPYVEDIKENYIYISDINKLIDSNEENLNINKTVSKRNKSKQISSKIKNRRKSKSLIGYLILFLSICLILILTISYFYKKNSNKNLFKTRSNHSDQSQLSNQSEDIQSPNDSLPNLVKQKPTKSTSTNWYQLDEDI